ncbi:MAG: hypothetical protein RL431_214 [Actinomycetota bacterium]|jgi:plasmid stability protein
MVAIQIRDVPEAVAEALKSRALREGLSVQKYLLDLITAQAAIEHNRAVLSREPVWVRPAQVTAQDIADIVASERSTRLDRIMDTVEP